MKKCWFFAMLFLSLASFRAFSAESEGILFSLKPDAVMLMSAEEEDAFREVSDGANIYLAEDEKALYSLREKGLVAYEEPNYVVTLLGEAPIDTLYKDQWMHREIGTEALWNRGLFGEGIRIAVVDSGVALHADLGAAVLSGYNYYDVMNETLNGKDPTDTTDTNGHGTFISGLIAARQNGFGTVGIAPKASIVPLRVFGEGQNTSLDIILAALLDAVTVFDCQVVNLSFGLPTDSVYLKEAIQTLDKQGAILVAAVGNNGSSILQYPAAYEEVIGVGALKPDGTVSDFSQKNTSLWVNMPGEELYGLSISGGYARGKGTSFSAPLVSALAAQALEINPSLNSRGFKAVLSLAATDLGETGYDKSYGHGTVRAVDLLNTLSLGKRVLASPPYLNLGGEKEVLIYNNSEETQKGIGLFGHYEKEKLKALEPFEFTLLPNESGVQKTTDQGSLLKHFLWRDLLNIQPIF